MISTHAYDAGILEKGLLKSQSESIGRFQRVFLRNAGILERKMLGDEYNRTSVNMQDSKRTLNSWNP